jgi:hypothetical protein
MRRGFVVVSGGAQARILATSACAAFVASVGLALAGCRRLPAKAGVSIPVHRAVSAAARDDYLGSRACVPCHQRQAEQLQSRHARTLAAVTAATHGAAFQQRSEVFDPFVLGVYRTAVKDGRCVLELAAGNTRAAVDADFAFGSGNRGVTYVGAYRGQRVELRLSYYARLRRWGFTPSQQAGGKVETPVGRLLGAEAEAECYRCHTTALVREAGGRVEPERSLLGVGCESCHGPGRAHVEAVRRHSPDLQMARLSSIRDRLSVELCGQCHRSPQNDDPASSVVQSQLPRLQGIALARSACSQRSGGKLSCVSCHDPHENADRTSRQTYNQRCLACHASAGAGQTLCSTAPKGDCVVCHMPEQKVDIPTSPTFHTHWIKVWEKTAPPPSGSGPSARSSG